MKIPVSDRISVLEFAVRRMAYALFVVSLVGCSVGPRYRKPSTTLQPFHNAPSIAAPSIARAPALEAWWTGFNDPELSKIIERVFQENLDLSASLARVQQARAVAKEAGAKLKPSASLIGQSNSYRQSLDTEVGRYAGQFPGFDRNQNYLDLGVAATWEVDLFGGLRRGAEAATYEARRQKLSILGHESSSQPRRRMHICRCAELRFAWHSQTIKFQPTNTSSNLFLRERTRASRRIANWLRPKLCWNRQRHPYLLS